MAGIKDLGTLVSQMQPRLTPGEFVFVTRPTGKYGDEAELEPIGAFLENEGLTLIVPKIRADSTGAMYEGVFRMITLQVNSSLEAVGLTAIVADTLAKQGICANFIAAFHHDHLFVPTLRAEQATAALQQLASRPAGNW